MITQNDLAALNKFISKYPSWWYRLGWCDVSKDFTCAPQSHSPEISFAEIGNEFDCGFSCDSEESFADAIYSVMDDIEKRVKKYQNLLHV